MLLALAVVAVGVVVWLRLDGQPATSPPDPAPSESATPSTPPPAPPPTPAPPPPPGQSLQPGATLSPCPVPIPLTLSVVTLNMHAGRTGGGRLDLPGVAAELRSWRADVVLLQEVDRGRRRSGGVDQARWLGQQLGMDVAYGPNRRLRPGESGNAVLSRHPIVKSRNLALPRGDGRFPRGLLRATLDVDGQRLDVYSTHLDHRSSRARRDQAREALGRVLRSPAPVILGGDLNATPEAAPLTVLRRGGLVDAWTVVGGTGGETAPSSDPRRRIDFVLTDTSFRALAAEVLPPGVSDHRGVRVDLALLPQPCR